MTQPGYMKVLLRYFPKDIQVQYNLKSLVTANNFIYIKIIKGMYGLKQAAVLAYNNLIKKLKADGYAPIEHSDSYWKHKKYPTIFFYVWTILE